MRTNNEPLYTVDHSTMPPTCLPTRLDRSNLVDVTRISDSWSRWLDTQTGEMHDGAVYAAQAQRMAQG